MGKQKQQDGIFKSNIKYKCSKHAKEKDSIL